MLWRIILFQVAILIYSKDVNGEATEVYVRRSGNDGNSGLAIGKEKLTLSDAYSVLSNDIECRMKVVYDDDGPFIADSVGFNNEYGITIEGWNSEENGNTEVEMDCKEHPGYNLFTCRGTVTFLYLTFQFPSTLRNENQGNSFCSLILSLEANLSITNCSFNPPETTGEGVDYYLVFASGGLLTMFNVECSNGRNELIFQKELFVANETRAVELTGLFLRRIQTTAQSVVFISCCRECDALLNNCTFRECKEVSMEESRGALFVDFIGNDCIFSVGDKVPTIFSSCSCRNNKGSGGMYLMIRNLESANNLQWPTDGSNLVFDRCKAGEGESERNIGLYLKMTNDSLFEDIANSMRNSFAINYTKAEHMWYITGCDSVNLEEVDFVSKFFDTSNPPQTPTKIYAMSGGDGSGESLVHPIGVLRDEFLNLEKNAECFIEIIATDRALSVEEIVFNFSKGIMIEGMSSDGSGNKEACINCDVSSSSALFTCIGVVNFQLLAFNFPVARTQWNALIRSDGSSTFLTINNCRFVRVEPESSEGAYSCLDEDESIFSNLVRASEGKVTINNVLCASDSICVSFMFSPFYFERASEVLLNGVNVSNMKIENNATFSFEDSEDKSSQITVDGVNVQNVNSEYGNAAGLEIYLHSEESTVAIGRRSRCAFKSCSAPVGKAGAIYIWMAKIKPNLQLPSAGNLNVDSSNTVGSLPISMFIESEGIDEFCKQENVFEFADAFEGSIAGWIMGSKNNQSVSEDLYEKYLKWKEEGPKEDDPKEDDPKEDDPKDKEDKGGDGGKEGNGEEEKPFAWWIIVIVVGVVAVVAVVCVILIVMKKKRSSKNRINVEDEENESEGKGGKGGRNKKRTKRGGELEEGRPAKNFVVDADSDGSSRKADEGDSGDNGDGTLEAEYETEEEEEKDRTGKNGEKEANWKGNASVRQHLDNVKQNINETFEQFEQKEQREKIGNAIVAEAVSHVLSSTSSSSSFSSVLNEEGLQAKELAAGIKGLIAEANVMSPLSE
ncbi:uncharacterized protein MONOS_12810 [Monocercomonoides exilis]|uniref:uncharacterized protein n=1 Tax=Monocercomonoides exilis TaxID=2049356 RepID=UPI003559DD20|nr:hypothetical protein MONOS_12810 [Monocercomonoides exilis]|eukprot:MONOS_12810.1-p1 / transcript=MONOS_12810.1 / gene=MONOS_12810 / organism=Monocercomonoides_exilis_PA203 / gene_product=unspecified product / transcript_product=unspecified product / location=Mono_scaffold00736:755-3793(-) / protein_length=1013 / sequence_SO=supercontig / SO=protein_coding / is_pseudo=false